VVGSTLTSSIIPDLEAYDGRGNNATKIARASGFTPQARSRFTPPNLPHVRGYDIGPMIGSGGMGVVYQARHRELNRTVALKMLRGPGLHDPDDRERFRAEAEAVARLQHPNIIQVFEIGSSDSLPGDSYPHPFIALELVSGGSLAQHAQRPQSARFAAEIVEKLARAAQLAHSVGVIHRDLKPSNVLMTLEGEPKIADFGLAKQLESDRVDAGRCLTQAGMLMGTPEYMPPEQATGAQPTPAIDIYALGVILYELLTARVPFQGSTPMETMTIARQQEPVSPRALQPGLSRDLETICLKCLEKEPGKRYASALALADDLRRFLDGRTIMARRVSDAEKVVRWCRRNPVVATSLAGIVVTIALAFILVSRSYLQAENALQNEASQRQEAQRKEQDERWERYRANITATASLFGVYDAGGARRSLQASPEEHRNWEWRHFYARMDLASRVIPPDEKIGYYQRVVSRDGRRVILFGEDGVVRFVDTRTGAIVRKQNPKQGNALSEISYDGKSIAYAVGDDLVEVWYAETGRILRIPHGHGQRPHSILLCADASRLLTAAADQFIRVWDTASGVCLSSFRPYESGLAAVNLSPNGHRAVVHRSTGETDLWNVDAGTLVASMSVGTKGYTGGDFNRSGSRFVAVYPFPCADLRLWDTESGKLLGVMSGHENTALHSVFSPDDSRIATSSMDQTVRLWDGNDGHAIATLKGHKGWVICAAFSPDSERLVSASQDSTLRLWNGRTGAAINVLPGHETELASVAYHPSGTRIVSLSNDSVTRFWDPRTVERDNILRGHTKFVYAVAYHPDGVRVVSCGWDGTARVWDAGTEKQLASFDHGKDTVVTSVAVHPDGKLLATRTIDAVYLWDLDTGREVHRWKKPSDPWRHTRLAFSAKGDLLASGGADQSVIVWDVTSRAEVAVLKGHKDVVRDVAFSPDGQWLASAGESSDKTVRIWSLATRQTVAVLDAHTGSVYALGFNRDGKLLATGSIDGTARLWDTASWTQVGELKHGANVYGVAFTPDGTRLACACANNAIRLWDVATRKEVVDLRGHTAYAHSVAFSPDGTRLVSGSGDCTVRIWDTTSPQDGESGR
jgi:eukaryotic-like serine/threonine-protein kinase